MLNVHHFNCYTINCWLQESSTKRGRLLSNQLRTFIKQSAYCMRFPTRKFQIRKYANSTLRIFCAAHDEKSAANMSWTRVHTVLHVQCRIHSNFPALINTSACIVHAGVSRYMCNTIYNIHMQRLQQFWEKNKVRTSCCNRTAAQTARGSSVEQLRLARRVGPSLTRARFTHTWALRFCLKMALGGWGGVGGGPGGLDRPTEKERLQCTAAARQQPPGL